MARQQVLVRSHPKALQAEDNEFQKRMGKLEGVVRFQGDRYWFSVRDMTREESTIHGFGVDIQEAVTAVEQLMELLEADSRRNLDGTEDAISRDMRPKNTV